MINKPLSFCDDDDLVTFNEYLELTSKNNLFLLLILLKLLTHDFDWCRHDVLIHNCHLHWYQIVFYPKWNTPDNVFSPWLFQNPKLGLDWDQLPDAAPTVPDASTSELYPELILSRNNFRKSSSDTSVCYNITTNRKLP